MEQKRLLVAEHDPETARFVRDILEDAGHVVEIVQTGVQAWEVLQTGSYDVLICDEHLPELDGYALLRKIRFTPALYATPIIMIEDPQRLGDTGIRPSTRGGADMIICRSRVSGGLVGIGQYVQQWFRWRGEE